MYGSASCVNPVHLASSSVYCWYNPEYGLIQWFQTRFKSGSRGFISVSWWTSFLLALTKNLPDFCLYLSLFVLSFNFVSLPSWVVPSHVLGMKVCHVLVTVRWSTGQTWHEIQTQVPGMFLPLLLKQLVFINIVLFFTK